MPVLTVILVLLAFLLHICMKKLRQTTIESVPGPMFALPWLGHLLFVGNEPHKTFLDWKKNYGPIFSVQLGHLRSVVLNDLKFIKEAFAMAEPIDRPKQEVFQRACSYKGMAFCSGPGVFEQRKFFLKYVRKFCYDDRGNFESTILKEISSVVHNTIEENLDQPYRMKHEFNIPALNVIWSFFMGERLENSESNKYLAKCAADFVTFEGFVENLGFFVPSIARLFPNLTGAAKMYKGGVRLYDFVDQQWRKPCPSRISGQPKNYKEAWMDKSKQSPIHSTFHPSNNYFPSTMGDILNAAIETTAATIDWALIHLARNPQCQKQLQQELDSVVGTTGLITLEDRPQLPYTQAVIHEVLRISSLGPLGLLHCTREEWNFHGYKIPAGTCVIGNLYAAHHDPEIWENPSEFQPERFLDSSNSLINTRLIIPFSTGKRNCVGENIARDQIFLFLTNIFYKYNLSCSKNIPDMKPIPGISLTPKPYEVVFSKRLLTRRVGKN